MNRKSIIAVLGACSIVWLLSSIGFQLRRSQISYNVDKRRAERDEQLKKGTRNFLPGPYLTPGDAKSLHFEVVDLGLAELAQIQISEKGDILYLWSRWSPAIRI